MAAGTAPIFVATPKTAAVTFVNADGTAAKALVTAGANGSRVLSINAITDDTSANDVLLSLQLLGSGTVYGLGGKRVPLASGTGANPATSVQILDAAQIAGLLADGSLQLAGTDILKVAPFAAVTAAKTLTIVVQYADY